MQRRAILSVFDKTGVVDFAKGLLALDFELLSTGGTHRALTEAGLPCTEVSDITGFPECLDGRVKTLHPAIHGGLLAMRGNPDHMARIAQLGIAPIDVVAVNLYPFAATIAKPGVTLEECIENIDIGGPTMLRAAAKNWQDVAVVVHPADYDTVLRELRENGEVCRETKFALCGKVFEHTSHYDALINAYLRDQRGDTALPEVLALPYERVQSMRYGENPHQAAAFYREARALPNTLPEAQQLHGKELSYNNINDANGALDCLKEFGTAQAVAVAVKHANPCGVGVGDSIFAAYQNAYNADPVSIFGGIVALNRPVDAATATELAKIFLEIIIAPAYDADALEILKAKKNLRLLQLPALAEPNGKGVWDMKRVTGGLLVQELDTAGLDAAELQVVTERAPTDEEKAQLLFAWKVVKHVKSNGIALVQGDATVGIGPGQTNRVTALALAIQYAGERAAGSVMASDAFFPFDDCVQAAHAAGITAIIQPGGSIRDADSIALCNKYGIAMLFTGIRHFKH
ncbi:MAG: bifunctional phosphoribosylaminoimidazolecarboxamide formyltransferase/IMP cyclohydrolase [Oscillospiraceae bacterium]|jgi:phosphoribosylaminoimidazolecarboxamide formyltransferase/IMP cyclohydrolase|nr:bifunctional phosphoribosylaminoimidazolecarboxamide formyltransferase/IMP cyclohydrolase [Oscillospiraceae bacterium]